MLQSYISKFIFPSFSSSSSFLPHYVWCMCLYSSADASIQVHVEVEGGCQMSFVSFSLNALKSCIWLNLEPTRFWFLFLSLLLLFVLSYFCWVGDYLSKPQWSFSLTPPFQLWFYRHVWPYQAYHMGNMDPNTGLHTCIASNLTQWATSLAIYSCFVSSFSPIRHVTLY